MSLYFDTSALAKLLIDEPESADLRAWIGRHRDEVVTNVIGFVELQRLAARVGPAASATSVRLLDRVGRLSLTAGTLSLAAQLPPAEVRTLDALQVASAAQLTDLAYFVTYDHRQTEAASGFGLPVVAPGRQTSR